MIGIRDEMTGDHDQIRKVTMDAFANSRFGHNGEADLIDALRRNCDQLLSLVAWSDNEIVGHILFSPVVIRTSQTELYGMGLAPMSVMPAVQNIGVGSSLATTGLDRLFATDCPFVVVLGHPTYYPRFGFQPAWQFRISHGFVGIAQDPVRYRLFMIPAILEKATFSIAIFALFARERVSATMLAAGIIDFVWGILFVLAYWQAIPRSKEQAEPDAAPDRGGR